MYVCFFITFSSSNRTPKIVYILTLYQANAASLTPSCKEDKILIKYLYECNGYNARQLITEFPDKGWTNNSITGAVDCLQIMCAKYGCYDFIVSIY